MGAEYTIIYNITKNQKTSTTYKGGTAPLDDIKNSDLSTSDWSVDDLIISFYLGLNPNINILYPSEAICKERGIYLKYYYDEDHDDWKGGADMRDVVLFVNNIASRWKITSGP